MAGRLVDLFLHTLHVFEVSLDEDPDSPLIAQRRSIKNVPTQLNLGAESLA